MHGPINIIFFNYISYGEESDIIITRNYILEMWKRYYYRVCLEELKKIINTLFISLFEKKNVQDTLGGEPRPLKAYTNRRKHIHEVKSFICIYSCAWPHRGTYLVGSNV